MGCATRTCTPRHSARPRAGDLTGRNHHSLGLATIAETSTGYPGYNAILPFDKGMLSEMLLPQGYNTFVVGKWHLQPNNECNAAAPRKRWPLGRGFERFYGFLVGETNQWYPDLVEDNHFVDPPRHPRRATTSTKTWPIGRSRSSRTSSRSPPEKPFFLYYCTGAGHTPHHVPKEWADKYKGHFDPGWDRLREESSSTDSSRRASSRPARSSRCGPTGSPRGTASRTTSVGSSPARWRCTPASSRTPTTTSAG